MNRRNSIIILGIVPVVVAASLLKSSRCLGFDNPAHEGICVKAFQLLKSEPRLSATEWPNCLIKACSYPDAAVTYPPYPEEIPVLIPIRELGIKIEVVEISIPFYALNSSEHYFDPENPSQMAFLNEVANDIAEEAVLSLYKLLSLDKRRKAFELISEGVYVALSELEAKGRTYDQFVKSHDGSARCPVMSGEWYNAISAVLFYVNGRDDEREQLHDWDSNPSGASPTEGFVALAERGELRRACVSLGCAIHYVEDLFSPGHTCWNSWTTDLPIIPISDREPTHGAFDSLGDSFFERDSSKLKGIFCKRPNLAVRRDLLETELGNRRPRIILSFAGVPVPCTARGGKNLGLLRGDAIWNTIRTSDLGFVLFEEAGKSQQIWIGKQKWADSLSAKQYSERSSGFVQRLADAVEVTAGVIDWAFSRAAPADGPYERDATNFYGMAASLLKSGEGIVELHKLYGKRCWLGGIDQDDYFPVSENDSRYLSVRVNGKGTLRAEVWLPGDGVSDKPRGPFCEGSLTTAAPNTTLKLDLTVDPPREFLLRVYTPEWSQSAFSYCVSEWDEPARPEGKIAFTSYQDLVRGRACEPRCGEIYIMNPDGSEKTRLTHNESEDKAPTWSPDGKKIAFQSMRDGDWELYMIDVETREETRLTYHFGPDEAPAWSPVNNRIAFHAANKGPGVIFREESGDRAPYPRAGDFHAAAITSPRQICVMDVGDGNPGFSLFSISAILDWHRFCAELTANRDARGPSRRIWDQLSPQARSAAEDAARGLPLDEERKSQVAMALNDILRRRDFYREEDFARASLPREAKRLLRQDRESLSDREVKKLNRLLLVAGFPKEIGKSHNVWVLTGEIFSSTHPCWSPDGGRLAFQSDRGQIRSDIYVVDMAQADELMREGKQVRVRDMRCVTESMPQGCFCPAWSPDRRIAFCSPGGGPDLWVIDPDVRGGQPIQLTQTLNIAEFCPTWSRKGRIAFHSNYDSWNNNDIYVIDVRRRGSGAGGVTHYEARLTEDTAEDSWPSWSAAAATDHSNSVTENARDRGNSNGERVLGWLGLGTAAICSFVAYRLLRRT